MAAKKKKRTVIEWVGGLASLPNYVTGEGEPYRPEALFWIGAEGAVLGSVLGKPGEVLGLASESLRATIARPVWGEPHAPERVRVASPELASALREGHPGLDVVLAPTPEIDGFVEAMREKLGKGDQTEQSYLSPEIGPEAVAALFRAAAALFRAKPWQIVPSDQSLISVTIERFQLRDAALTVIGQMGESLGFVLFANADDFEAFVAAADAVEDGERPALPRHLALHFDRGAELSPALRKEIADHRWEVVSADAYPSLVTLDEDLVARPLTAEEITLAEALALALPQVLADKQPVLDAWNGGEPVVQTLTVQTHTGELDVTLRIPHPASHNEYAPPYDVLAALAKLDHDADGDELDRDACAPLEEELLRRFFASPEGKTASGINASNIVLDLAASFFGATIASLEADDLEELVFEIFPRKVMIGASAAGKIITEIRALYAFLKREFALKQADDCLAVLGGDAVEELEAALSDSGEFDMAKSLLAAGSEAGFDMNTPEGIEAWMRIVQSRRLAPSPAPSRPLDKAAQRAKKNKRKAASRARKKNR